jgi:hypothetical protein
VIIAIFNAYLPDVDWSLVDNVFTLTEPLQVGFCSVYDALMELRKRAPSTAKIRFYNSFRQVDWAWQFRWFDVVTLSPSGIYLVDDPDPGAGESNYWTFQRVRDGMPIYNRWYVVGKDPVSGAPIIGSANDTTSQTDLTVIIAGISENTELGTVAACNAEAARILVGKSRARESFTGIETHTPLLLTGPQSVYVKNDLEPGITTPQPFPVSVAEFSFPNMIPTYRADLGDRWLALGEEEEGRLYGTAPTRDLTAPDAPTWPHPPGDLLSNTWNASTNTAQVTIQWNSNTEGDLFRYRVYRRFYTNNNPALPLAWQPWAEVLRPTTQLTSDCPAGSLVGFKIEAEDTAHNVSEPSTIRNFTAATESLPQPTSLAITDYGFVANPKPGSGDRMWVDITLSIGAYVPSPNSVYVVICRRQGTPGWLLFEHYHRVIDGLPIHEVGLPCDGFTYVFTIFLRNQYGTEGPPSDPLPFTTKRVNPPPSGPALWLLPTKDGLPPGYDMIQQGEDTTWEILEAVGDQGTNVFHAHLASSSEYIILEQTPLGIVKNRPLSWAFSVRADQGGNAATGTVAYKIKWCDADYTVLNTQTIKTVVPPSQTVFTQYKGKVDAYPGAVVAIVRLEYSGTSGAEDVYIGLVQLSDQQEAFNMGTRAVLPTAINLLVPGMLQNGSMEQPNLQGNLPDGYDATGTYFYGSDAGTADGFYSITLGGTTGSHSFQTPYIFWTYPIRASLNYGLRVKWSQYHVNAIGPTREVWAQFYNSTFGLISSARVKANDATTNYVVPTSPNPGDCEALVPGSIIPNDTAYIRLSFQLTTTNSAQLWTVDAIETAPAATILPINALQFRSLGGALQNQYTSGPTLPSNPLTGDRHWYTGTGKNLEVFWDGSRWLSVAEHPIGNWTYYVGATVNGEITASQEYMNTALRSDHAIHLTRFVYYGYVSGTNNGSNYHRVVLRTFTGFVTLTSFNTSSWGATTWTDPTEISSFTNQPSTSDMGLQMFIDTPVGSPAGLRFYWDLYGRLKVT